MVRCKELLNCILLRKVLNFRKRVSKVLIEWYQFDTTSKYMAESLIVNPINLNIICILFAFIQVWIWIETINSLFYPVNSTPMTRSYRSMFEYVIKLGLEPFRQSINHHNKRPLTDNHVRRKPWREMLDLRRSLMLACMVSWLTLTESDV